MITECNAFDYEFSPVTFGKRFGAKVYGFEMASKSFEATFYVFGQNRKEFINQFYADCDYDVQNEKIGRLVCNGYYIPAYSLSAKDGSNNSTCLLWDTFKRGFFCPYPFWTRISADVYFFEQEEEPIGNTDIKDYLPVSEGGKADYEFDYQTSIGSGDSFFNEDLIGDEFQIIINGYAENPIIRINGVEIALNVTIQNGEHLTIDSREKTIILTKTGGAKVNCYGNRDVSVDIFQKIPYGTVYVSWEGNFSWVLKTFEERTAPIWT